MHSNTRSDRSIFGMSWNPERALLTIILMLLFFIFVFLFMTLTAQSVRGQTFSLIHTFTGGQDGANPWAGLTMDGAGNFYGTAANGGLGYGTVFKLTHKTSGWLLTQPYSFQGGNDGANPLAPVIFGPDGNLYGTTVNGGGGPCGGSAGCGTVFKLQSPATVCQTALCPWPEMVLHRFTGGDGANPQYGDVVFDPLGNIYGTTGGGGVFDGGTVYELTPSDGGWTESVLCSFAIGTDGGADPRSGVVFDGSGNLYGTTYLAGHWEEGTVYQLTPSGSVWIENIVYPFFGGWDGNLPVGGLIFDRSGNLYGTASVGGLGGRGGGTVFELTPAGSNWEFSVVYALNGEHGRGVSGPEASLVMDTSGNLYGTTAGDGAYGYGNVFRLSRMNGAWTYTSLHDFTGGSDGGYPYSAVTLGADGNLYGTASAGGSGTCNTGCGVVWKIAP